MGVCQENFFEINALFLCCNGLFSKFGHF